MIFDAHLDLALNAVEWNRDLTQPIAELRRREQGMTDKPDRARGTVAFPEMRRAGIGLCVATQIARVQRGAWSPVFGWHSPSQAWAMTQGQLAWYRAMEAAGEIVQIRDLAGLEDNLKRWSSRPLQRSEDEDEEEAPQMESNPVPIGYILSLEGADSLLSFSHLERAVADGLRAVGPAHYGPGIYANGTDASGGFNSLGRDLLRVMERLGVILDVTHLCDESFWEALDLFHGSIWASHQNCRALVPHQRQFSDEQLRALIERGAVIGCALDAWMLVPGWERGKTTPQSSGLRLEHFVAHIDHICQIAGNARHIGIGSDLDGAFGSEQTPQDLDTIADLTKLEPLLTPRGYNADDIQGILCGNFVNFLRRAWR